MLEFTPCSRAKKTEQTYDFGSEGWLHFPRLKCLPVDVLEERMDPNCRFYSLTHDAAEAPSRIFRHKLRGEKEVVYYF